MRTVWKKAIACVAACLLALLSHVASGQTPSQNYVREAFKSGHIINATESVSETMQKFCLGIEDVDSVIIRTLDWSVIGFGYIGYNRKAFDEAFNYILNDS